MWFQQQFVGLENGRFVYIGLRGGIIKIGVTDDPSRRAKELKLDELLLVMPGGRLEERALHRRFAHARIGLEWFQATPDLLAFIVAEGRAAGLSVGRPAKTCEVMMPIGEGLR